MARLIIKRVVLSCAVLILAELLFCVFGRNLVLSSLTLHSSQQRWRSVSIDGKSVSASGPTVQISPLIYGPHDLRLEMADGKVIYVAFFHSDTGVDRKVNIYVDYQPNSSIAGFRQTITRYETFPGITRTVFIGRTHAKQTSEASPFTLDWI